ncbi:hypothetical protein AMJ39_09190 [candidate division TA06 bacterium DG_24]|jgi:Spy/CpxP family protein refolding chaperone|uniref:Periplasmic heavy metal sensor n=2 Tax=Bacteria division TA06 TaxID=1156500 RepID=A0A0S8JAY6_UNCT6|nr:MAG: hypothetical protein AMJ39_09190 [candidate division TA06 bacterium DG_24]KPL05949.1 MAG: hypothetical protein AMJ71_10370 [candidate division TA06 bacterium SM1_40]
MMRQRHLRLLASLTALTLLFAVPALAQAEEIDKEMEVDLETIMMDDGCLLMGGPGYCLLAMGEEGEMEMGEFEGWPLMGGAGGPMRMGGAGCPMYMGGPGCCAMLDLTEQQQKRLQEMRTASAEQMFEMKNELGKLRIDLRSLILSETPDQRKIERMIDQIGELQTKIMKQRVRNRLEMRNVLTPEQWEKWRKFAMSCPHGHRQIRMHRMKGPEGMMKKEIMMKMEKGE